MKYEIAEYLEARFDFQPDRALMAAEHIVKLIDMEKEPGQIDRLWTALHRCREALKQRENPEAGSMVQFALETADSVLAEERPS